MREEFELSFIYTINLIAFNLFAFVARTWHATTASYDRNARNHYEKKTSELSNLIWRRTRRKQKKPNWLPRTFVQSSYINVDLTRVLESSKFRFWGFMKSFMLRQWKSFRLLMETFLVIDFVFFVNLSKLHWVLPSTFIPETLACAFPNCS